jgi:hypothetical protein
MAYVQETSPNHPILDAIGKGIQGGLKGFTDMATLQNSQKQTQAVVEHLGQQSGLIQQQLQTQQQQYMDANRAHFWSTFTNIASSDDPGSLYTANKDYLINLAQKGNMNMTDPQIQAMIKSAGPEIVASMKTIQNARGLATNPAAIHMSDQELSKAITGLNEAYDKVQRSYPMAMGEFAADKQSIYDQFQKLGQTRADMEKERIKADAKVTYKVAGEAEKFAKEGRVAVYNTNSIINGTATRGAQSIYAQWYKRFKLGGLLDNMMAAQNDPDPAKRVVITKQVALEMARNFDSLVSMGGASERMAHDLVPPSMQGLLADLKQKTFGNVEKYMTDSFLENFAGEVSVERNAMKQDIADSVAGQYFNIKSTYGDEAAQKVKSNAIQRFRKEPALLQSLKEAFAEADSGDPGSTGGPKVGTVEDGHKFLGGNPADPKSWQKI